MNESHSNKINHKVSDFSSKIALASINTSNSKNIKKNGPVHPTSIYIYDAPNDLGLPILQAIFQIAINPFHSSHIYSAFILPDNLNRIFFEATDLKSVRRILHFISGIKSVPKNLPVIRREQINQYFVNPVSCLHFHPGQIVTLHNPEFDNQIGQIVDIKKESGKVLIKTYPHIDYNYLRRHTNCTTQTKINEVMGPNYKAPMVPFQKEGLVTTNSFLPIWNSQVNAIKWDNKFFIGKFQYVWINYKDITHKKTNQLTAIEKSMFSEGISDYEKTNLLFMKGFNGQLDFEGTHKSDTILQLSLNKGMPSWARKKSGKSGSSSSSTSTNSSSDSENKIPKSRKPSNLYSKSQITKENQSKNQFSQSRSLLSSIIEEPDNSYDSRPILPDIDDDYDGQNSDNNEQKKATNINSPVFVDSSSSNESDNDNVKNDSKSKKSNNKSSTNISNDYKLNSKNKSDTNSQKNSNKLSSQTKSQKSIEALISDSSSDSDIGAIFNRTTANTKTSKKSEKGQTETLSQTKKTNSKPTKTKKNETSTKKTSKLSSNLDHLSRYFSSDFSDTETQDKTSQNNKKEDQKTKATTNKSKNKKEDQKVATTNKSKKKHILTDSSSEPVSDSSSKSFIDLSISSDDEETKHSSSYSSSDAVEIIEPVEKSDKKKKKKKKKSDMKPIINELMKESVDFGNSPPSQKTYFNYASSSENDESEDESDTKSERILDKESIYEELSQQISKKKMRKYYKSKGLPVPDQYKSDSYSVDSDSSSSSS